MKTTVRLPPEPRQAAQRLSPAPTGIEAVPRHVGDDAAPPSATPASTRVPAYGKAISLKRFRCRSAQNGVTCTVIRTGKGFRIDGAGITRVGG